MKVNYCDEYDNVIVSLTRYELGVILGYKFGDRYGNHGEKFDRSLIGREYDLKVLEESLRAVKVAHEFKTKSCSYLKEMINEIETKVNFYIPEIKKEGEK